MISQRDIILISFPFSNLKESKVRPVIVMSNDSYNKKFKDFIAVPLTSNLKLRDHTILVTNKDLESGKLIVDSQAKIDKIFSIEKSLVRKRIGKITRETHQHIKEMFLKIIC